MAEGTTPAAVVSPELLLVCVQGHVSRVSVRLVAKQGKALLFRPKHLAQVGKALHGVLELLHLMYVRLGRHARLDEEEALLQSIHLLSNEPPHAKNACVARIVPYCSYHANNKVVGRIIPFSCSNA